MMWKMPCAICQRIIGVRTNGRSVKMPRTIFCALLNTIIEVYIEEDLGEGKKKLLRRAVRFTISDGLIFVIASAVEAAATAAFVTTATAASRSISTRSCFIHYKGFAQEIETV